MTDAATVAAFLGYRDQALALFPLLVRYPIVDRLNDGPYPSWEHFNAEGIPQYHIPDFYNVDANQLVYEFVWHECFHELDEALARLDPTKAHHAKFLARIGKTGDWDALVAVADALMLAGDKNGSHAADPREWWAEAGREAVRVDGPMRAFFLSLMPGAIAAPQPIGGHTMKGIDYANARGAFFLNAVKQAGYDFVVRYLDGGRVPGKQLTIEERDRILSAGLGIFLVYETTGAGPWTAAQGHSDAQEAITAANALGYPDGAPIFYAVDQGLAASEVVEYFNGTDEIHYALPSDPLAYSPLNPSHFESGAYGDYDICETAATVPWRGVPWRWQTAAWSGGKRADGAQLYQAQNGVLVAGSLCDIDELAPGVTLPAWKWNVPAPTPPDPLWSRPDSSPWTVGDARLYAQRLQTQLETTYVKK
jgi:Domain of unknown function (DUF1906)